MIFFNQEIRTVQFEDVHGDDEMEMSDDDNQSDKIATKRAKYDNENLKVMKLCFQICEYC